MQKVLKLCSWLESHGHNSEANFIRKIAAPLPDGADAPTPMIERQINLGGVKDTITADEIRGNMKLKEIFNNSYDKAFFNDFSYVHFFQGDEDTAGNFINTYYKAKNPREMSVVATRGGICSAFKNPPFKGNFVFLMDGTPTSAFYWDAMTSHSDWADSDHFKSMLKEQGVDPKEYLPKINNLSTGSMESFFYDKGSYEGLRAQRSSDYHEVTLKDSKVIGIILTNGMDLEMLYEFYYEDGEIDDLPPLYYCSGDTVIAEPHAVKQILYDSLSDFSSGKGRSDGRYSGMDWEKMDRWEGANSPSDPHSIELVALLRDILESEVDPMEVFHAIPSNALRLKNRFLIKDLLKNITKSIVAEDIEDVFYNMRERGSWWWRKEDYDFLYKVYIDALSDTSKLKPGGSMERVRSIIELLEDLGEDYRRGSPEVRYSWEGTKLVTENIPFDRPEMLRQAISAVEPAALKILSSGEIEESEAEVESGELGRIRAVSLLIWKAVLENDKIWIYEVTREAGSVQTDGRWLTAGERKALLETYHAEQSI